MLRIEVEAKEKKCWDTRKTRMSIDHKISCMLVKGDISPERLLSAVENWQARAKCTASACPVWRWDQKSKEVYNPDADYYEVKNLQSNWKGYCGIGGKP